MFEIFNNKDIEKYSSAVTLSDMEIFIFPELLYSLLLANIMSPIIWEWKKDEWFKDIDKLNPYRKILRLKQYIMDNYDFNLDIDTWGLTTKENEIARFEPFMNVETISRSNALFGYEGDKYYFSMDIRRHFGLDKYNSNMIPYWKTETVEAMNAFKYKKNYEKGAGECVSLSTLYAAALFIICKIPLKDIYLLATPLHSQNFVDVKGGIVTNNRRIVTKNMWFNGTELTVKAQRAIRNEQITIISHNTGFVHVVYPEATIDHEVYMGFEKKLKKFLVHDIDYEMLCNFLRQESHLQKFFQIKHEYHGGHRYIPAEKAYAYEHTSSFKINKSTRDKLLSEIDEYEFSQEPIQNRICLNNFDEFFKKHKVDFNDEKDIISVMDELNCPNMPLKEILTSLYEFCNIDPRLPGKNKNFIKAEPIQLSPEMSREDIVNYLESIRDTNVSADLAFYALRDFSRTEWDPFIKAALERNPVSINMYENLNEDEVINALENMPNVSIYNGSRMAQPDEVCNYQMGDGLEKAICLANILKYRNNSRSICIRVLNDHVEINFNNKIINWPSNKGLNGTIKL
ncbi:MULTISPECIES: hypothetical protein [Clostridium]|uniref:Uncharacterized protein n=2 Tax=Clostridium TaxID=1485 RepID=D8GT60_CLOLD|nr:MULTISPECIES: hypothetical protein [Clostridium]ADK16659.1 conserved hypothetical protein [Clostridium ljungdahlii DSM 13528]OAA89470.1 hypothetical protein WX45_01302 [Clostridium ljungdahlii DSM 13528]OAA92722.1 hypothetical protein WX73_00814 [Clostridium coskatii]OBR94648.1 hypothetical protein CLCOS_18870 [Clostridium coskatii]